MTKRGYKLQEFVAHSSNVNCLSIGKKSCRLFLTGGDDFKVNLWAIGKPDSLMSLCGHTSPVESVAFDATEVLVLGGASSGVIKLWDLEEAKMVRGLTGHRSNCTAVEFHPFGEFFASGSTDTNLKIWDIRKRGCIHTYKGHTRGINTVKFTPDGRWVVSGGCDSIVKIWDLTAGKLLHDFKFHENHIRTIQFHPLEFLMATGSADRTVKYWDLETFELIGSSRPEGSGVRACTFHPDGKTLFCGLEDSFKVYSWEPVVCHDTVDMGWSSLGDLCIHEGKLVGCSYYQNSVGVWAADTTLIEPFAKGSTAHQVDLPVSHSPAIVESSVRCTSPNDEAKEIKNIYVDTSDGKPVSMQLGGSVNSSRVPLLPDLKDNINLSAHSPRKDNVMASPEKSNGHSKSLVVPFVATPDNSDERDDAPPTRKDSVSFSRTKPGMLLRPAHSRKPSNTKYSIDRLTVPIESPDFSGTNRISDHHSGQISEQRDTPESTARQSSEGRHPNIKIDSRTMTPIEIPKADKKPNSESTITPQDVGREFSEEKFPSLLNISEKMRTVDMRKVEKGDEPVAQSRESDSVKIVRGVAVMTGRTRTLVEKFEKRERSNIVEEHDVNTSFPLTSTSDISHASRVDSVERKDNSTGHESDGVGIPSCTSTTLDRVVPVAPIPLTESSRRKDGSSLTPTMDNTPASRADAMEKKGNSSGAASHQVSAPSHMPGTLDKAPLAGNSRRKNGSTMTLTTDNAPASRADATERKGNSSGAESHQVSTPSHIPGTLDKAPLAGNSRRKDGSTMTLTTDDTPASRADATERKGNSSGAESHQVSTPSHIPGTLDKAPLAGNSRRKDGSSMTLTTDDTPASRADAMERKGNSSGAESHQVNTPSYIPGTLDKAPLAGNSRRKDGSTLTPTAHNTPASRADAMERKGNSSGAGSHQVSTFSYMPGTLDKAPLAGISRRKDGSTITPTTDTPLSRVDATEREGNLSSKESHRINESSRTAMTMETVAALSLAESYKRRGQPTINVQPFVVVQDMPREAPSSNEKLVHVVKVMDEREPACTVDRPNNMPRNTSIEFVQSNEPQVSGRMESDSETFVDVIELLMQSNEVFLSTMRSRLTKLQAVHHFWERKDIKGAINALKRLPDHSVQTDVISVLMEKMDILNLDLFSCLLPVLVGLLDSKIERHAVLSMETLMKLVAVFGPVVRSTISARPTVGVDLHAEERLECCNHCWTQLQKIQKILPLLVRKGGLLAKSAQELNLVLQQS